MSCMYVLFFQKILLDRSVCLLNDKLVVSQITYKEKVNWALFSKGIYHYHHHENITPCIVIVEVAKCYRAHDFSVDYHTSG